MGLFQKRHVLNKGVMSYVITRVKGDREVVIPLFVCFFFCFQDCVVVFQWCLKLVLIIPGLHAQMF